MMFDRIVPFHALRDGETFYWPVNGAKRLMTKTSASIATLDGEDWPFHFSCCVERWLEPSKTTTKKL